MLIANHNAFFSHLCRQIAEVGKALIHAHGADQRTTAAPDQHLDMLAGSAARDAVGIADAENGDGGILVGVPEMIVAAGRRM